ncbi:Protein CBG09706 [Caenorhabditis briggsae]|uniref:Protein CBG09706 n=2 Tax=Caenorhabditis briggsae TaxID=6238 RepID=A8X8G1_CAEBR|nr:Protein CBG09706 [Caenorhabditis briggsae]ULT89440.1 hypothetical protein L3Y34_008123 [Caenorhabditis briggsae]CAP28922.1 Protein CBG09706 [Caenorhabditis briggsae]
MILNLFTISAALFGLAVCGNYGRDNYDAANSNGNGYYAGPHFVNDKDWGSSSSSSSESDEKRECARLGVFNVTNSFAPLFSAPKIAYYTRQGKDKAIVVCPNPQVQILVAKSRNANPTAENIKNYALISISSKSGVILKCNKRKDRYEGVNLPTGNTVPLDAVACVTANPDGMEEFVEPIYDFLVGFDKINTGGLP